MSSNMKWQRVLGGIVLASALAGAATAAYAGD